MANRRGASSSTTRTIPACFNSSGAKGRACRPRRRSQLAGRTEEDMERSAAPGVAFELYRAAETADDPLHHRESEAVARRLRGEERIENPGLGIEGHAAARIRNVQPHELARAAGRRLRAGHWRRAVRIVITPSRSPIASDALVTRFITN